MTRIVHLLGLAAGLALATACGGLSSTVDPGTTGLATPGTGTGGGTSTGSSSSTGSGTGAGTGSGTGAGTGTGTGAGTGTGTGSTSSVAGDGGFFGGPYATNPTHNCALSAAQVNDIATVLSDAANAWGASIGGPIDPQVLSWAGTLSPANQYWGAQITGASLNPSILDGLSYGFATDASMALINPISPTPLLAGVTNGGLADGYYEVITPFLFTVDASWSAGHMPTATRLTMELYVGVQNMQLVSYSIDGITLNSVWAFDYGTSAWNGDPADPNYICSVFLDMDGRTVTPN